jgi:RNA polymerase sigma factor (TIGR02999 family)
MPERDLDISGLLQAWSQGEQHALGALVPLITEELRRIARGRLARAPSDPVLTPTVLVQEAYLRLLRTQQTSWQGRVHFFALCSKIMRDILVDHARSRQSLKRSGKHVPLDEAVAASHERSTELVVIDEALRHLATFDPRKARVVEFRFFGGMTVEETAEALHVSAETVMRDWRLAKLWLLRYIDRGMSNNDADGMAKGRGTD